MKFVEEVVVETFLPTFRALLASDLRERGLTQEEVATVLGVSQSAVSKYAQGRVRIDPEIESDERVQSLVGRLGEGLAAGDLTPVQALVETEVLIRELEAGGDLLARRHERAVPELAEYGGSFRVHDPESSVRESERVRASVRRGLRVLETTSGFAGLIPNVGSNLVEALPGAEGVTDVSGVPGRIVDVKGRATVPAEPEFGVSEHVASVLLAARAAGSEARAALNVRYDPELVAGFEAAGHRSVAFDPTVPVEAGVTGAMESTPGATVVYQTGAMGIEPILYLLGEDAVEVATAVRAQVGDPGPGPEGISDGST